MADDDDIFGGIFSTNLFEDTLETLFDFALPDFWPEWLPDTEEVFDEIDTIDRLVSLDIFGDIPKPIDKGDHTTISWDELTRLGKTSNPRNKAIINEIMQDIEESGMTMEEIQKADFERPYEVHTARDDEGHIIERKTWLGIQDSDDAMHKAKVELEAKGVPAPSGGGGMGSSYGIIITSDQWQRIRRGEITEEEAEWENDDANYDPETGEMYDYDTYPDEDEDDDYQ